ncbi:MAG: SsrA-binding protein SmpB [Candidatus Omnitrophica bacterium]|nr:SsrA-binding protein SmpB [Candidatus Omnitrophota bacterium]
MDKAAATNRQARFHYHIFESFEAGIELKGTEVKSLREGNASLSDSFARVDDGEIFLYNCHIGPYAFGNIANVEPLRTRKLLLHKKEIGRLLGQTAQKGMTLIPLKIYFNKRGIAKVELAVAKGKLLYDKRESIKDRDSKRELKRALKSRSK